MPSAMSADVIKTAGDRDGVSTWGSDRGGEEAAEGCDKVCIAANSSVVLPVFSLILRSSLGLWKYSL